MIAHRALLLAPCPRVTHPLQVGYAKHKAYGVKDVGFAAAVEASDGVELRIEGWHRHSLRVRLEAVDGDLFNIHDGFTRACLGVRDFNTAADRTSSTSSKYRALFWTGDHS